MFVCVCFSFFYPNFCFAALSYAGMRFKVEICTGLGGSLLEVKWH